MARNVWPQFMLERQAGGLVMHGVPNKHLTSKLSHAFLEDATLHQWKLRQAKILQIALTTHQQDHVLKSYLKYSCSANDLQHLENNRRDVRLLHRPIFESLPRAGTGAVQALIRILAGMDSRKTLHV